MIHCVQAKTNNIKLLSGGKIKPRQKVCTGFSIFQAFFLKHIVHTLISIPKDHWGLIVTDFTEEFLSKLIVKCLKDLILLTCSILFTHLYISGTEFPEGKGIVWF